MKQSKRILKKNEKGTFELLQGTWVHNEDSNYSITIDNSTWIDIYKGSEGIEDTFNIRISNRLAEYVDTLVKAEFLILFKKSDTSYFEILGLNENNLSLMHYPSMHKHFYSRIQKK